MTGNPQTLCARWSISRKRCFPPGPHRATIRSDHCFKRIAYDVAVGAKWDTEVTPPFSKNTPPAQLRRAVTILREMAATPDRAADYNQRSLRYRDVSV